MFSRHASRQQHTRPHASNGVTALAPLSLTTFEAPRNTTRLGDAPESLPLHAEPKVTVEDLRRTAYDIYLRRLESGEDGTELTDWQRAEVALTKA